jgi:hypothetical protein
MIQGFEKYRTLIDELRSSPITGDKQFYTPGELINDKFLLFSDGKLSAYYVPFHYMNRDARVVLVGLTPGWTQMERAFRTAKREMANGLTGEKLFQVIATSGSFSGSMRKILVSMLDGIGLNQHLKLLSCSELFGAASTLVHFTSAVSAPTFIEGKNFTGHGVSFLKLPKFRAFIVDNLAKELALLPNAVIIPLGKIVDKVIDFLRMEKLIDPARCLIGFPHPSGQNGHRKRFYEEGKERWREQLAEWFASTLQPSDAPSGSANPIGVSFEKPLESDYRIVNFFDDLGKICDDRIVSVWIKNPSFKRYVEEGMSLHFHFGLCSADGKSDFGDYCAIVQSDIDVPLNFAMRTSRIFDANTIAHRLGHCEELMFISGIQLLKKPEMILLCGRSRIRLAISDFDKCVVVDSLIEMPPFNDVLVESNFGGEDREEGVAVGQLPPGQSPSNIIERGACVMDAVADDHGPLCLGYRFSDLQLEQICRLFTIIFSDKGVGLRIEESPDFCTKRVTMYFSSLDFVPRFE